LVDGYGADGNRGRVYHFLSYLIEVVTSRREVHDGVGPPPDGAFDLLYLLTGTARRRACPYVGVDLHAPRTDGHGVEAVVVDVRRYHSGSVRDLSA